MSATTRPSRRLNAQARQNHRGPMPDKTSDSPIRLVISCPDQTGIRGRGLTVPVHLGRQHHRSDQYSTDHPYANEPGSAMFFLRMEFTLPPDRRDGFSDRFGLQIAERFGMTWRLWDSAKRKRVAVLVSREDHCLLDLLWRWRRDELHADIVHVISNWEELRTDVEAFGLPYFNVPMPKDGKREGEQRMLELLRDSCDVVVLARYMQILSGEFPRFARSAGDQHPPLV